MPPKAPAAATETTGGGPGGKKGTAVVAVEKEEILDEPIAPVQQEEEKIEVKNAKFSFPDGAKYEGDYAKIEGKNVRHGQGTYINGPEKYIGTWEFDKMRGKGQYHFATGAIYEVVYFPNIDCNHCIIQYIVLI
jgi:hypothetical protein